METEKRHFNSWSKNASGSEKQTFPGRLKLLLVVIWLILMGGLSHSVVAQVPTCTLTCNDPTPDSPLQFALGANCEGRITTDVVLQAQDLCPGGKRLTVRDEDGNIITEGINEVLENFSPYIDQVISVTVVDTTTGVFCTSFIEIVDNQAPDLVCVDTLLACTADTSVANLGMPLIADNCDVNLMIDYFDVVETADCNSSGTVTITRTWTAIDASQLTASCTQSIVLERPDLMDIQFPSDVVLPCEEPFASPDSTGFPTIDGIRVQTSSPCDLVVTYQDDTTFTCNKVGMTIARNWLVLRRCDGATRIHDQIIDIKDDTPPIITCPDDFTVENFVGECSAMVILPAPDISDNCDAAATFFVNTSFGGSGLGPFLEVPEGPHTIQYTAIDACGNASMCTTSFEVIDTERPTAICDDEINVSLTDGGVAIARALSFDEGSEDNCVDQLFYKARRMNIGECADLNGDDDLTLDGIQEWFDDYVFFCCEDLMQDSLRVLLRVFTVDPGEGGVDPDRLNGNGDLTGTWNECMAFVTVNDKIRPELTCPPSDTVDCRENLDDFSIFGSPIVREGCEFVLDSFRVEDLDECGTGTIFRTFTATDNSGNSGSCTQTIIIENQLSLVDTMITWPMDVETNQCGATVLPQDLDPGFDGPTIDFESCSLVGISYTDTRFDVSFPACYKILRRWSVIDWCQFNEGNEGRFTYTQTIKVEDDVAPTITCGSDIIVGINSGSCNTAQVTIPPVTATDNCSPGIRIINDSKNADDDGADASGIYPIGTSRVTYTASDNCGNLSTCSITVTVEDDKAPAPICIEGLVATLHESDNDEIMAAVQAETFIASSTFDNCHVREDLEVSIRKAIDDPQGPPTGITELEFNCSEVGIQNIEIWLTDPAGNSDYCRTTVEIQDNNLVCPVNAIGFIAGDIQTEAGKKVEQVVVSVMNTNPFATFTDVNGGFMIDGIPYGEDLTVVPKKEDDLLNGVSTMDMILISKHILGLQPITSPYGLIAADIDASGGISTLDLIRLRKLILNKDQEFPNGNTSWRFIDSEFVFPVGVSPLKVDFPELKNLEGFNSADVNVKFVAVKVGDVNASVRPNTILQSEGRTTNGDVVMKIKDREFESGETFSVDVYSEDLFNLIGFQFTLDYDERLVELVDFTPGELPRMSSENFGVVDPDAGLITTSWNEQNDVLTVEEAIIGTFTFRAIRSGDLYTALELKSNPTLAEAYNYNSDPMQILLQFVEENGTAKFSSDFRLYQNHPNPFRNTTKIGFVMPKRGVADLRIFDISGRIVYQIGNEFPAGYNEIEVGSDVIEAHGLFYYRLETEDHSATRKMIRSVSR